MDKPTGSDSSPALCRAVRRLRRALKESQMDFAYRIGCHLMTIYRYETTRPPKGATLAALEAIARERGLSDLADLFKNALYGPIEQMRKRAKSQPRNGRRRK